MTFHFKLKSAPLMSQSTKDRFVRFVRGRFQPDWFPVATCRLWQGGVSTRRPGVMWSRTSERSSETRPSCRRTSSLGLWRSSFVELLKCEQCKKIKEPKKKSGKASRLASFIWGTSVMIKALFDKKIKFWIRQILLLWFYWQQTKLRTIKCKA